MTSVPIPVINKENNKLIPSTYKPKLILREGTQFTAFIIVCPELVIGNSERKYKNKAKDKIKKNKTVCILYMYLFTKEIKKNNKKKKKKKKEKKKNKTNQPVCIFFM